MSTVYQIAITPRQRWELAAVFNGRDQSKTASTVEDKKTFNRTRRALGLAGIMSLMNDNARYYANSKLVFDNKTKHAVSLTDQQCEYVYKHIFPLITGGAQMSVLEDFIDSIDTIMVTKKSPEITDLLPIPDEDWSHKEAEEADKCKHCFGTGLVSAANVISNNQPRVDA